ncbi:hypothetical protein KKF91_21995 [Myxococcota bacterium]|nr:hypothetical protein [Myxococcota bacterium]
MLNALLVLALGAPQTEQKIVYDELLWPLDDGRYQIEAEVRGVEGLDVLRLPLPRGAEVDALRVIDGRGVEAPARVAREGDLVEIVVDMKAPLALPSPIEAVIGEAPHFRRPGPILLRYLTTGALKVEPGGHRTQRVTRRVINTGRAPFSTYTLRVQLPIGRRVHQIEGTTPPVSIKDPNKPYAVRPFEGGEVVEMRCAPLRLGDECAIRYTTIAAEQSKLPLLLGLLLGALYLIFFRHVLKEDA